MNPALHTLPRAGAAAAPIGPAAIGHAATLALHDELALAPKPGLVSFVDSGSHDDMDAHTFMRSLFALRRYFVRIAELGAAQAPFCELERCGIAAEARMLAATGGINTHRGAIFALGLLCAAFAAAQQDAARGGAPDGEADGAPGALLGGVRDRAPDAAAVRRALQRHWGAALLARCQRPATLPGAIAARRLGLRSASQEAALGFPTLFETALPAAAKAREGSLGEPAVRLQVFFSILAVLDDSNLAHRGGLEGLAFARSQAAAWLKRGGAAQPGAGAAAGAIHRAFVARRLSPGGCADMLAASCFLDRVTAIA